MIPTNDQYFVGGADTTKCRYSNGFPCVFSLRYIFFLVGKYDHIYIAGDISNGYRSYTHIYIYIIIYIYVNLHTIYIYIHVQYIYIYTYIAIFNLPTYW